MALEKKESLDELMRATIEKVHEMVDTNTIVGQPIITPDDVTLIPVSKVSVGFGSGGGSYGKTTKDGFGGGGAAGLKIEPVCFLTVKDGVTRLLPVAAAPSTTVERIVDMAPDIVNRVEKMIEKKANKETE